MACIVLAQFSGEETTAARLDIGDTLAHLLLWPLFRHRWRFLHRRVSDCGYSAGATVGTLPVRRAARCRWRCLCRLRGAQAIQGCAGRGRLAARLSALRGDGASGRARLPALREARAGGGRRRREPEGAAIRPRRESMAREGFVHEERQARGAGLRCWAARPR